MTCLGAMKPHWLSAGLGTGYLEFESPTGLKGLAKVEGARLDILALLSDAPGSGSFRNFVAMAKMEFSSIYIWEVWNEALRPVLERYGFTQCKDTTADGEKISGYVWRKE